VVCKEARANGVIQQRDVRCGGVVVAVAASTNTSNLFSQKCPDQMTQPARARVDVTKKNANARDDTASDDGRV
jgi:hypothetical protein